jgi:quercetin dioxygenase-like cupin family protein
MHRISLDADGATVPLQHPMESVYYVIDGAAVASDLESAATHELRAGSMILIDPNTPYVLTAAGSGAQIVGGPCPPDPGLYGHLSES